MLRALVSFVSIAVLSACSTGPADRSPPAPGQIHPTVFQVGENGRCKVGTPYEIFDVRYTPVNPRTFTETGVASWYGPNFHGKLTANGETYDQMGMTAAHPTLPMPSIVRVTRLDDGRSIVVRINDRGPFHDGRVIDLSRAAAQALGVEQQGLAEVEVVLLPDASREIRSRYPGCKPNGDF